MEDEMTQVPLWIVASLGKEVVLAKDFVGPCRTYPRGSKGILSSIEVYPGNYCGAAYVTVAIDPEDRSYLENFRFTDIEPLSRKVRFSLNLEEGLIAF